MLEDFINKRHSLRNLSDERFEEVLPILAKELMTYAWIPTYESEKLQRDYNELIKFEATTDIIPAQKRCGMKLIEHFQPGLWKVQNWKGKSVWNCWIEANLIKALRFNRKTHSTPYISEIRRAIYFTCGLVKTTAYRPTLMKRIVEKYNAHSVLDPCIGWGGRMIGTTCLPFRDYVGIEPNTETYNGLDGMRKFLKLDGVELYNESAETALPKITRTFDMVLTSPPYFNLEIYTDESTQSVQTYKTYSEWKDAWLTVLIEQCINKLNENGLSCWNVANFTTDGKYKLVDDVIAIHNKLGYHKIDEIGISSSKKPTSNKAGKEKNLDLTMIFKK